MRNKYVLYVTNSTFLDILKYKRFVMVIVFF